MITADTIEQNYDIIWGAVNYDPDAPYSAVALHNHVSRDTTSTLPRMVHAAVEAGLDVFAVTDHDSTEAQDKVRNVVKNSGYENDITIYPGVEITARGPRRSPRHVLVYGVEDIPELGLSPTEVNMWANEHPGEVYTAVAHPELLNVSVLRSELADIQSGPVAGRFNFVEAVNGEDAALEAWRERHRLLALAVGRFMPDRDTNSRMQKIAAAQHDLGEANPEKFGPIYPVGGNDAHNGGEIANAINLIPVGMTLFEAASSGNLVVAVKRHPEAPALWRLGVGFGRGFAMNWQREREWRKLPPRTENQDILLQT
jgi:PHP domain-containing protein